MWCSGTAKLAYLPWLPYLLCGRILILDGLDAKRDGPVRLLHHLGCEWHDSMMLFERARRLKDDRAAARNLDARAVMRTPHAKAQFHQLIRV